MADVTERGQLIIVMGLVLAVTFVVLALLLNTVIFTENLASRGTDLGGRGAVEFQRTFVTGAGELIDEENAEEYGSQSAVEENITAGVEKLDSINVALQAERGVVADIDESSITYHEGELIRQTNGSREMTPDGGLPLLSDTWTLATDISDTRQFSVRVTGGLQDTSTPSVDAFAVTLEDTALSTWKLYIYENGSAPELAIQNATDGSPTKDICASALPSSPPFTVDLTAGTVNGTPCNAIDFAKELSGSYDIKYILGNRSTGTYNLTINTSGPGDETSNLNDGPSDSPYHVPAVYSMTVDIEYETVDVTYRSSVRVARGEPA